MGLGYRKIEDKIMAMNETKSTGVDYIYNLTCEDASHLGGPMGSEYTTHIFTKPFTTVKRAKQYAVNYVKKYHDDKLEWNANYKKHEWSCDARTHIFHIKGEQVL